MRRAGSLFTENFLFDASVIMYHKEYRLLLILFRKILHLTNWFARDEMSSRSSVIISTFEWGTFGWGQWFVGLTISSPQAGPCVLLIVGRIRVLTRDHGNVHVMRTIFSWQRGHRAHRRSCPMRRMRSQQPEAQKFLTYHCHRPFHRRFTLRPCTRLRGHVCCPQNKAVPVKREIDLLRSGCCCALPFENPHYTVSRARDDRLAIGRPKDNFIPVVFRIARTM